MGKIDRPEGFAALAGEMAVTVPALGLKLLQAEMEALARMMPGLAPLPEMVLRCDAELEADFDNMPV